MKKILLTLILFLMCVSLPNFAQAVDMVRVGISPTDFSTLSYSKASVSAVDNYEVYDKTTDEILFEGSCGIYTDFVVEDNTLSIYSNGKSYKKGIKHPIGIRTKDEKDNLFTIKDLKRKEKQAFYKGEFEVSFPKENSATFSLINVLPLEEYLKGVVPNEMPVSFGLEALKAQAVAARNYTLKSQTKNFYNFDVCDSVQCQVYFGAATQSSLSDKAVEQTRGLYAIYNKDLIIALYSSTAGGCTESYHNVFPDNNSHKLPSTPIPYLIGKADVAIEGLDLTQEEQAQDFYVNCPKSYDIYSPSYRWTRSWSKDEFQTMLSQTLPKAGAFISPKVTKASDVGEILDIKVLNRGVSGKAITIEITTSKGIFELSKELSIRRAITKNGAALPSANIVFRNVYSEDGLLQEVKIFGGGFGHGVGMSQYGAGYMSLNGHNFDKILKHYYSGISIATAPAIITGSQKADLEFVSPNKKGILVIDNPELVSNLSFRCNGHDIVIDSRKKTMRVDISRLIRDDNYVSFWTLKGADRNKKVKVRIEIFGEDDE